MQKKKYVYPALALLFILSIFGSLQAINFFKPGKPAQAASQGDWAAYLNNPGHSSFNGFETAINPSTAGSLKQLWSISEGSIISTQPVVANGLIDWGSWDGIEHATHLDGSQAWAANLGTAPTNCPNPGGPAAQGILSTATIATVMINGTPTTVDLVGSASDSFYALNASTGAVIWKTSLGAPPYQVIWASPTFYNGSVYIGVASNDCPLIQGKEFQLNASTGAIQNTFNTAPNGCTGSGVVGSAAIDTSNGTLYFATGNGNICSQAGEYGQSMVQLNASNLSYISSWQVPDAQLGGNIDPDFLSSPTLFTATMEGSPHHLVGVVNKTGIYYAFDEATIANGPVWQTRVAVNGECPYCGTGSASPSAWDGTNLYVAGGNTTINNQSCQGGLRALNPATGAVIWAKCMPDGPVLGAVSAVPGVVAVTEGNALWLMAASDGHSLFQAVDTSNKSFYYAAPSISNGVVYAANRNGNFFAYGLASNSTSTPKRPPSPGTILEQDTFQRANQTYWGIASGGRTWGGDANTANAFSVVNNSGQVSNGSGIYNAVLGSTATNAEVVFSGSMSSFKNANLGAVLRWTDTNDLYKAYIDGTSLVVQKKVIGSTTILGSVAFIATAGTSYTLRFRVVGKTLYARVWKTGTTEPKAWMVAVTDTTFTSGYYGLRILSQSGANATYTSFKATAQ
jgi:outer membrane protein assembly factor BamB